VNREFRLPDIGEGLTEAEIVKWLVAVGETVTADQPIVEVETDKAVVEIPSPYAGTVVSLGGAEGEVIEVGEVLVVIGDEAEVAAADVPASTADPGSPPPVVHSPPPPPIVGTLAEDAESLAPVPETATEMPAAVQALPIVRKLARDNDIDLSSLTGSGPNGRITREDVEAAIAEAGERSPALAPERAASAVESARHPKEPPVGTHAVGEIAVGAGHGISDEDMPAEPVIDTTDERRPMSRLRRTIAANMARSWAEVPHVTTFDEIDATRLLEVRQALGDRHGMKIPIEALVIKAVLPAIGEYPEFNATVDGDDLIVHGAKDLGIAVDTPDGLLVAVVRSADRHSVLELAGEVRRLGEGARNRTLSPDELTGQTFTISNIGAVGGGHGTPIVPPGTTAILSVGAAKAKPIVYDGDLAIAPVMPLSLSYDHRVIDGAQGRRFMALVMENLEEPALFLA
jgi:pyruvate dehydrogenase E2 component (dihydrolipoamide acetyltransferase)